MSTGNDQGDQQPQSVDDLQAAIESTREDLAETVNALSAKTDVKARVRDAATDDQGAIKPVVPVAAAVTAVAVVALVVWRMRRRRNR